MSLVGSSPKPCSFCSHSWGRHTMDNKGPCNECRDADIWPLTKCPHFNYVPVSDEEVEACRAELAGWLS